MICTKCGAENPDYFVFCKECSAMLPEPGAEGGVSQSAPARAGQPLVNRFKQASQSGGSGFAAGREELRRGNIFLTA